MRRHGWAFCLGLLVGGPAAAQPPVAGEPSPPAQELPGVVVAQAPEARPLVTPEVKPPAAEPGPATPEPAAPVSPPQAVLPGPAVASGGLPPCATPPRSEKPTLDALTDWCLFRSRARQSGHYPTPYLPPLQAWFPCEPRRRSCAPCGIPTVAVPVAPCATPGLEAGPSGTVVPVAPPAIPQVGCPTPACRPDVDVLSGFLKTGDGLMFVPGSAPMAGPTKQVHRVSHWRPK